MAGNLILRTDSYKFTHWKQYPPGTQRVYSYFESRGGKWHDVVFFGLQYYLKQFFAGPVVTPADDRRGPTTRRPPSSADRGCSIGPAGSISSASTAAGCRWSIKAVPEGSVVPGHNVLMTIENTDPACYWLPNYLETLLVQVWYGSTVATQSREMKKPALEVPAADRRSGPGRFQAPRFRVPRRQQRRDGRRRRGRPPGQLPRHRHLRGHHGRQRLLRRADGRLLDPRRRAFHDHRLGPRARSRRHAEHARAVSQRPGGRGERQLRHFRGLREDLGRVAPRAGAPARRLRGDPARLGRPAHGAGLRASRACWKSWPRSSDTPSTQKGYKVLDPHVRIIQGDAVDFAMLDAILYAMQKAGFSADNIAFGSGGGLLQKLNRDTLEFAFKCAEPWSSMAGAGRLQESRSPTAASARRAGG